jgi:undecaprenyl-diphosphatase
MAMYLELVKDVFKLTAVAVGLYLVLSALVRRRRPDWVEHVERHRVRFLLAFLAAAAAFKIGEDVISGDSAVLDTGIMYALHAHAPAWLVTALGWVTYSGSSTFLTIVTALACAALWWRRRWREAVLLALALTGAAATIWFLKALVGRERPHLWEAEWYWGSSFPSGHTLASAAFATAVVLIARRLRPRWHATILACATLWIGLVALSRMVLGVHWPTDVLAAACIGAFVAFLAALAVKVRILGAPPKSG